MAKTGLPIYYVGGAIPFKKSNSQADIDLQ